MSDRRVTRRQVLRSTALGLGLPAVSAVPGPGDCHATGSARPRVSSPDARIEELPRSVGPIWRDMLDTDHPRESCGVFGVWAPGERVANLVFYGLYALQHRGQESAGMAVADGTSLLVYKDMGLVSQVFDETTLETLQGHLAIGHTRYSTSGASRWENASRPSRPTQPAAAWPSATTA